MKFKRDTLKVFREDFEKAVATLEKKYGAKVSLGSITFTADEFQTKMTVINSDAPVSKDALDFKRKRSAILSWLLTL